MGSGIELLGIISEKENIRSRTMIVCLISALGIYAGIYSHRIIMVVFIIDLLSMLMLNNQEIFCELFFLLPFTMVYKINPASTSLFTYLTLASIVCLIVKKHYVDKKYLLTVLLLVAYLMIGTGNNITSLIKLSGSFVLAYYFVVEIDRKNFCKIVEYLSLGVIISSFIGLRKATWPQLASFFSSMKSEYINGVSVNRFTGLYLDPNYYSILIIVCLIGVFLFAFKREINKVVAIIMISLLTVFGCITYSKVFFLALALSIVAAFIIRIKTTGKYLGSLLLLIFICVIGYYFASKFGVVNNILYRFSANDISNNRLDIWKMYIGYITDTIRVMLFGVGIGAGNYNGSGAHNYYIETWYYLGIVGSVIYFYVIIMLLKRFNRIKKRTLMNYSLLIILMFMFATLGMLLSNDFIFLLLVAWIVLNTEIMEKRGMYNASI